MVVLRTSLRAAARRGGIERRPHAGGAAGNDPSAGDGVQHAEVDVPPRRRSDARHAIQHAQPEPRDEHQRALRLAVDAGGQRLEKRPARRRLPGGPRGSRRRWRRRRQWQRAGPAPEEGRDCRPVHVLRARGQRTHRGADVCRRLRGAVRGAGRRQRERPGGCRRSRLEIRAFYALTRTHACPTNYTTSQIFKYEVVPPSHLRRRFSTAFTRTRTS